MSLIYLTWQRQRVVGGAAAEVEAEDEAGDEDEAEAVEQSGCSDGGL